MKCRKREDRYPHDISNNYKVVVSCILCLAISSTCLKIGKRHKLKDNKTVYRLLEQRWKWSERWLRKGEHHRPPTEIFTNNAKPQIEVLFQKTPLSRQRNRRHHWCVRSALEWCIRRLWRWMRYHFCAYMKCAGLGFISPEQEAEVLVSWKSVRPAFLRCRGRVGGMIVKLTLQDREERGRGVIFNIGRTLHIRTTRAVLCPVRFSPRFYVPPFSTLQLLQFFFPHFLEIGLA